MPSYSWESIIAWNYTRFGSLHAGVSLTNLSNGRKEAPGSAVDARYNSVDCKIGFIRAARIAEFLFPSPGHRSLLIA
jgi:hypothetical protein